MSSQKLKEVLPKLKEFLNKQEDVASAYVYGSYAEGKEKQSSDLDIGIVFSTRPQSYNRILEIGYQLEKLASGIKVDARELSLTDSPVFLMSALKKAVLICENNPLKRVYFEVKVMQEYSDTQKGRDIQYYYLQQRIKEDKYANQ